MHMQINLSLMMLQEIVKRMFYSNTEVYKTNKHIFYINVWFKFLILKDNVV